MRKKYVLALWIIGVFSLSVIGQEKMVTGTVTDVDGQPLLGASVIVKGASRGTLTDFDGKYTIEVSDSDILEFSYVQHLPQDIEVGDQTVIDVVLIPDNVLGTVIITGYNSYREDEKTSSVSLVAPEEIEQVPIASLDQVLQGRVAGVNVSTGSGQPGQSATLTIRGLGSINGDVEPLYVIDGVFVDQDNFRSLNANDIENITVLKDASASALYGSRAAGGVVVITTKRGKFNSPLKFTYRTQYGISFRPNPGFDVLDSQQLLEYQRLLSSGAGNGLTDAEIAEMAQVNTNWRDILFRTGIVNSHEVTVSKGSDNARSYTSFGYYEQEGITQGTDLQRFTFRTNNDIRNDRFSLRTNLTANFSESNFTIDRARNTAGGALDNPFIVPFIGLPFQDAFNEDGSLNTTGTIASGALNADGTVNAQGANGFLNTPYLALNTAEFNTDSEEELRIIGSVNATLELVKNVKVGATLGVDYLQQNGTNIVSPRSIRGLITPTAAAVVKGSRTESDFRQLAVNFNTNLTYENTFNDVHEFKISLFTEYVKNHSRFFGFTGFGLNPLFENSIAGITNGQVIELDASGAETRPFIPNLFGAQVDTGLFSYFGVADYGYDRRYNVRASLRRDGSSFFPDDNAFATFWALSGRWNISNENFFNSKKLFSNLAARISIGTVGNQNLGAPFAQFDLFSPGTGINASPSIVPSALGNPNIVWETTTQFNFGLDFSMLDSRLSGTIDLYRNDTKDVLINRNLSITAGIGTIPDNVGEIRNQGVDLELNYQLLRNQNNGLQIDLFANVNYNDNEVLQLIDGEERLGNLGVGQSLGEFRLVRYAGVNPANGEPLYLDANGQITNQFNADDAVFLGKGTQPLYSGGFGADIKWKGFSLNMLWSFAAKQYRTNGSLAVIEDPSLVGFANQSTTVLDAWMQPGDITDVPNPLLGGFRFQAGDRYLENSSFLRLRNVVLGYTFKGDDLPSKLFDSLRLYAQGQNLLTFTRWRGFDPESNTGSSFFEFPTARTITFGVDVNF